MNIEPIEIAIDNNQIYAQVGFFVDHPETLKGIESLKTEFEITNPFRNGDYLAWKDHLLTMSGFDLQEYYAMEAVNPKDKKWSKKSKWFQDNQQYFIKWTELSNKFAMELAKIRRSRRFPPFFDLALKQAILFNKISEFHTASASIGFTPSYNPYYDPNVTEDAEISIKVSPLTTEKDLLAIFNEAKVKMQKEYESITPLRELPKKELSAVKRNRFVYWMRTNIPHPTFDEILTEWNNKCPVNGEHNDSNVDNCLYCGVSDKNVLEHGYSQYKNRLLS